jgi:hypothetical protein
VIGLRRCNRCLLRTAAGNHPDGICCQRRFVLTAMETLLRQLLGRSTVSAIDRLRNPLGGIAVAIAVRSTAMTAWSSGPWSGPTWLAI